MRGERGEGGHRQFCLPRKAHEEFSLGPHKFTERNPWFLPIRSLRAGREQHVPESSNHPLYLIRLFSFRNLEETPTQRHKHQHNRHKHQHNRHKHQHNTHTHTHQHTLTNPPTHRPTQHHSPPLPPLSLSLSLAHAHANANVHVYMHM